MIRKKVFKIRIMRKINTVMLMTGLFILFSVILSCKKNVRSESDGIHSYAELKDLFADPPFEYRSAPLWVWHEQITEEGIDFQMKEFKKAGIGGVFVHPLAPV